MPTILGNTIFYHIPHTGGSFINIGAQFFPHHEIIQPDELNHASPEDYGIPRGKYSFTIIRHPVNWHKSNYSYNTSNNGWGNLAKYYSDDPNTFIINLYNSEPHYLTKLYKRFMTVKYVVLFENYEEELKELFQNEDYDKENFWNRRKENVSNSHSLILRPETEKLILKQEKWIIDNFYA